MDEERPLCGEGDGVLQAVGGHREGVGSWGELVQVRRRSGGKGDTLALRQVHLEDVGRRVVFGGYERHHLRGLACRCDGDGELRGLGGPDGACEEVLHGGEVDEAGRRRVPLKHLLLEHVAAPRGDPVEAGGRDALLVRALGQAQGKGLFRHAFQYALRHALRHALHHALRHALRHALSLRHVAGHGEISGVGD